MKPNFQIRAPKGTEDPGYLLDTVSTWSLQASSAQFEPYTIEVDKQQPLE